MVESINITHGKFILLGTDLNGWMPIGSGQELKSTPLLVDGRGENLLLCLDANDIPHIVSIEYIDQIGWRIFYAKWRE